MKQHLSCIILGLLLITACTSSAPTMPPTVMQAPTAAVARKPALASIDLEALAIQPGDLPPMTGTVEKFFGGPFAEARPGIATSFARQIRQGDTVFGQIYVDVYTETTDAKTAYISGADILRYTVSDNDILKTAPIGDEGLLHSSTTDDATSLVFLRCHMYALISLPASREAALAYAKRLDSRLTPFVC